MKSKRLCHQSPYKAFSVKMPLKLTVILLLVFVFLLNPYFSASIPVGSNYGSLVNPYWQSIPHQNAMTENHFNNYNRGNLNGLRQQLYWGHNNRLEPSLSFLNQMGGDGRGGQTRFPKDYLEFLLSLYANGNPANSVNNPGVNPAKLFNHPNEVAESSPVDLDQDDSQPSPYELSLSSQNQPASSNHVGGQTKRNAGGAYMCHFKLCQSQMGVSWKRLWNPSVSSRETHSTP